ncbi:hypothetical protein EVAR_75906_1 [Eumeta japonica]|uniref:Uncharacterized protein n=1 Tax=Eumeta variegata TaxID=151549 RepID=A0A4C1UW72_EUMVA|nr:hypothetical protein EVAR_75906_1 [Eumeta japonica]
MSHTSKSSDITCEPFALDLDNYVLVNHQTRAAASTALYVLFAGQWANTVIGFRARSASADAARLIMGKRTLTTHGPPVHRPLIAGRPSKYNVKAVDAPARAAPRKRNVTKPRVSHFGRKTPPWIT